MELETLKTLWQEQETPPMAAGSHEELLALLQQRSNGPIGRLRRNLRKEVIVMAISYGFCIIFYLLAFNGDMANVAWLFVGLLLFFYIYYHRKNQLLKKMQCVGCEVRSNLAGQLKTLQKYLRFYFWSSTVIVPLSLFVAFEIAFHSRTKPISSWWLMVTLLCTLTVGCTIAVYFLNRLYIHKLYGRHLRKLQELLQEMDEV
jgi:4-hydroxybenzoate polyprenyltransferase